MPGTKPLLARAPAAQRMREYTETDCRCHYCEMVRGLASQLEPKCNQFDAPLLRDFMLFTNDLDVTRGQSFRETPGERLRIPPIVISPSTPS